MTKTHFLLDKHKLHWHPDVLDKFLKEEVFAPVVVEISPASRCNQRCRHCYTAYVMKTGVSPKLMNDELYFKAIKDCADFGVKALVICGTGEPLLHQKTPTAISYAKKLGLDVALNTNGVLATKGVMEDCLGDLVWTRFSTSAGSPKRYSVLQGSTEEAFRQMMANLKDLVKIKKRDKLNVTIGVTYFLFEGSHEDIVPFTKELKDMGVDYLQIKPCGDFPKDNYVYKKDTYRDKLVAERLIEAEKLNSPEFYCQIKYDRFHWVEDSEKCELPQKCWGLLFYTHIGGDGKVYTCGGSWYEKDDCYGSLEDNTLKEIWESPRFKEVFERKSIVDKKTCFLQCRNIIMNGYLMDLKSSPAHVNFI